MFDLERFLPVFAFNNAPGVAFMGRVASEPIKSLFLHCFRVTGGMSYQQVLEISGIVFGAHLKTDFGFFSVFRVRVAARLAFFVAVPKCPELRGKWGFHGAAPKKKSCQKMDCRKNGPKTL